MQFLTIAYGEPAAYDRTPPEIRNAAHDQGHRVQVRLDTPTDKAEHLRTTLTE
jgi:hypothetical protein